MLLKTLIGFTLIVTMIAGSSAQAVQDRPIDHPSTGSRQLPTGNETVNLDPEDFTTRIDKPESRTGNSQVALSGET